jgi:hypothetical protein
MKKRLSLRTERLTELTENQLQDVAGAVTGSPACILSIGYCVTVVGNACSVPCVVTG